MSHPDHNHRVRRVVLPSGKTIEVVYFDDPPVPSEPLPPAAHATAAETAEDLHVCTACGSELVYPVDWEEAGAEHWQVCLRCPDCEWSGHGTFSQSAVERFDEQLDRGTEAVVQDLRRLMHANMEDEIERFVSALAADHIVPDDF
jgi:hypothetical protein